MHSAKPSDRPIPSPRPISIQAAPAGRLVKVGVRPVAPIRVVHSARGPVFRIDPQTLAARRPALSRPAVKPKPVAQKSKRAWPMAQAASRSGSRDVVSLSGGPAGRPALASMPRLGSLPKRILTRYRILEKLGEGGTGVVFRAQDEFLDMPVAIKMLNPRLTHDRDAVTAFKQEARLTMRLSHQHIVHLHNLEKSGNRFLLVMEYIKGSTLREVLSVYGRLPLETVMEALCVCSHALSYAHRHGVLHNDLKPENILIGEDGVLKIIDFGISCLINTRQGDFIMGTPAYMSPEQIRGETLDRRTDVYSLGIITYEFLTGKTPFPDNVGLDDILRLLPVTLPHVSDGLRPVILKAVDPDREKRWESVEAYVAAFLNAARPLLGESAAAATSSEAKNNGASPSPPEGEGTRDV